MQTFKFKKTRTAAHKCYAERESLYIATQYKIADISMIASAVAAAVMAVSGFAYATSAIPSRIVAATMSTAGNQVVLTMQTESACNPGDHVAARITKSHVAAVGCWMQPNEKTVSVRWLSKVDGKVVDANIYALDTFKPSKDLSANQTSTLVEQLKKGGV